MAQADATTEPRSPARVVPADDSGAPTAGHFRYQHQVAAAHCLNMAKNGRVVAVVCEWHADFALQYDDDSWVLVSVKHRESAALSFAKLFEEGGLALLFDSWIGLDRRVAVRLCTNAEFSTSKSPISAKSIEQLCGDADQLMSLPPTDKMCSAVAWAVLKAAATQQLDNLPPVEKVPPSTAWENPAGLPDGMLEAARSFLGVLRIERFPPKRYVRDHVVRNYVHPLLGGLNRDTRTADECYDRLMKVVENASRDNDGRPLDPLERLGTPGALSLAGKLDERVRRRTITRDQVLDCMTVAHTNSVPVLPAGRRPPRAAGGRDLIRKLTDGEVGPDDREQALDLRDLWHDSWPRIATGFPQDLQVQYALEQDIMNLVRSLRLELAGADHFGTRLMAALHERLTVDALKSTPALPLHDYHLAGFAYELSDRCRFEFRVPGAAS
ncbi:uncharacterized protein DUF4297 [Saccharothrix texasensis]|uniref:Uncharacterized protein DUF4297 n=1 Tax=Saccharothrix texasensis TaxID=103734 RepID=A0A3N1HH81_9PSEU|nr:uncharacterized protein DUF4297 [Saccharothrix texasensis]